MDAAEIKVAAGVDQRAVKNLQTAFASGRKIATSEAYYVLTGIKPNKQYPDDLGRVCLALGINSPDGDECPDNLTAEQFATLHAKLA